MNSYEHRGSLTKHLPMPKDIHDYIDDVLKISQNDVPMMYYYGDYYTE